MSATSLLSFFFLLAISSGSVLLTKRLRIPHTVLLVAIGTFILVPLVAYVPLFSFIADFTLTPELLFYIFLPILIFESAYNMDIRRVGENIRSISALAIIGLLISSLFIAVVLTGALSLVGIPIPFFVSLLFGALISATDPVAVLALFKEFGVPRRLALIFEGESIFNDGTAVALFLVVLGAIEALGTGAGIGSYATLSGIGIFFTMILGGIVMGLVMGGGFAKAIGYYRDNEFASISLTIVLAHLTFILTEFISDAGLTLWGFPIHLSAIIATTVASLVMGNYGRSKMNPHAEEFVEKFWGQFAFLANSIVFILIGLVFTTLPFRFEDFVLPVIVTVLVVAAGRAFSIYPVIWVLNKFRSEASIPLGWQHLLAWGSLRGALAITMVLLIPQNLTVPGWEYSFSVQEFLMALTIGCIFATLFIKATTMQWFMNMLAVNRFTPIEHTEHNEARALVHTRVLMRLNDFAKKGYIDTMVRDTLAAEHTDAFHASIAQCQDGDDGTGSLADRVLRMYAIGIERHHLKELYAHDEINEKVYKRIAGKLTLQHDRVDRGILATDPSAYRDSYDVFEHLADLVRRFFFPNHLIQTPEEQYMYYRAQSIIARKVVKELGMLEKTGEHLVFGKAAFERAKGAYQEYVAATTRKMQRVAAEHPCLIADTSERLARCGILKVESNALDELFHKEMITPKTYIAIRDELERDSM